MPVFKTGAISQLDHLSLVCNALLFYNGGMRLVKHDLNRFVLIRYGLGTVGSNRRPAGSADKQLDEIFVAAAPCITDA